MDFAKPLQHALAVVDRWLAYNVATDPRLPGLSVGIVQKDQVVFCKGYGYADVKKKVHASENTCYRIASFSKIFTTIAALQLVEQKKLMLDAPVQQYLPWFVSATDPHLESITIRHLLTHTAGLDRDGETTHWDDFQFPNLALIQQHVEAGATVFAPLERWKYSNFGFTLLGEVIKRVVGISYEEYVTQNVVKRLGLELTAPTLTEAIREHLAVGYGRSIPGVERESFPQIETHVMASATGFASTVFDLCHFMMAQFEGNTLLLSDEMKREMRQIQSPETERSPDWCLGLESWQADGRRLYGHSGGFPGFISRFAFDPEREIGVVLLANAIDAPSDEMVDSIWKCIHYFIKHADTFAAEEAAGKDLTPYVGTYRSIWSDVEVVAVGNHLLTYRPGPSAPTGRMYQLRYEKDDHYRITDGYGFGNVGELVRFEWDGDMVKRVFVGPGVFERVPLA